MPRQSTSTPRLCFSVVPSWGWRAHQGSHVFEIEREYVPAGRRIAFRAYVRRRGTAQPVAKLGPVASSIAARAWLEAQHRAIVRIATRQIATRQIERRI